MPVRTQGTAGAAYRSLSALAAAVLMMIVGCSAPPDDAAMARGDTSVPPDATAPHHDSGGDDMLTGDPADEAPVGVVRLVVVGEPAADPVAASPVDPADVVVLDLLYDGLTRWDDRAGTWKPDIADSIVAGRGGRTWTFVLGDRRFSDGRAIAADDVVAGIERLRSGSALVADRLGHMASIRAVDDATVRVRLTRPDAAFPALLSHPLFGVTPELDGTSAAAGRVGSGPLHVADAPTMALVGADSEWEVRIVVVDTFDAGLGAVRSGVADLMYVPPSYVGPITASVPSGVTVAYALHAASPRLASAETRRALVARTDVETVASALPGLAPEPSRAPDAGAQDRGLEVSGAVSLAIVGPGNGGGGTGEPAGGGNAETAMAVTLASQWSEAGLEVTVEGLTLGGFVSLVSAGRHDVIRTGWVALYPGDRPHWTLVDAASDANVTGVEDAALTALMRRAERFGNPATVQAVEDAIAELGVLLPIGRIQTRIVTAPGVDFVTLGPDGSLALGGRAHG